jgi:hypothetical protein
VRENALDELRVFDARYTQDPPAAAHTLLDVDSEYALQSSRPSHADVRGCGLLERGRGSVADHRDDAKRLSTREDVTLICFS